MDIIMFLVFVAGLASAYTPDQQTTLDGMNLSFEIGIAHEKARQGQNVSEFNFLVDIYNAWIRQHFGEDANLFMQKINDTAPLPPIYVFNPGSELSQFGKKQVYDLA